MWPTESPWPALLLCSIPAAALLWLALRRSSLRLAMAGGLLILVGAAAVIVDRAVVTDAEQIEENLVAMIRAFEDQNLEEMLRHFSTRAVCERVLAEFAVGVVTVEHPLSIKDVQVTLQENSAVAQSTVRVNGSVALRGRNAGHHPSMWRITWNREEGDWRIARLQELDPLREEPINRLSKLGAAICQ